MADVVLVVEDDRELREFLAEVLAEAGFEVVAVATADAALRALESGRRCDVVLTDLILPGLPGQVLLEEALRLRPELNVIVMTAFGTITSAIALIRGGAYDYLPKPLTADDLVAAIRRALAESHQRRDSARLSRGVEPLIPGFVGASQALRDVFALVARAATVRHPVLITGESGTGKELVARALHQRSGRRRFVTVNCGALPEALLESELFGHARGAFTGAQDAKEGLFEAAHGGTLFLDEIADLALSLQPKLLRALEEAEVRRVGSTQTRHVDVRLVAATNSDLDAEVAGGRFREDLYWRLNVVHIVMPPLRERAADIPLLAEYFLARANAEAGGRAARRLSPEAMALLTAYGWPGNVRELRNAIQQAATLCDHQVIGPDDLPPRIIRIGSPRSLLDGATQQQLPLHDVERLYVLEILRQTGGNKSRAADVLGLDRKTLYRKLQEFGVEP